MIEFPHLMTAVMAIIALASLATTIIMNRGKAAADKVTSLEMRLDDLTGRTTAIEGELKHLPSRDQAQGLELALRGMQGELGVLAEKMRPIQHTVERLQEFLIDEARAKRGMS